MGLGDSLSHLVAVIIRLWNREGEKVSNIICRDSARAWSRKLAMQLTSRGSQSMWAPGPELGAPTQGSSFLVSKGCWGHLVEWLPNIRCLACSFENIGFQALSLQSLGHWTWLWSRDEACIFKFISSTFQCIHFSSPLPSSALTFGRRKWGDILETVATTEPMCASRQPWSSGCACPTWRMRIPKVWEDQGLSTVTRPVSNEVRLSSASQGAAESTWSESTGLSPSGPCRAAEGSHWIPEGGGAAWGTASKMSCGCQGHRQPAEILLGEEKEGRPWSCHLPALRSLPGLPCELGAKWEE